MVKFENLKKTNLDFNFFDFCQNRALKLNLYAVGIWNLLLRNHILIISDVINRDDSYL